MVERTFYLSEIWSGMRRDRSMILKGWISKVGLTNGFIVFRNSIENPSLFQSHGINANLIFFPKRSWQEHRNG